MLRLVFLLSWAFISLLACQARDLPVLTPNEQKGFRKKPNQGDNTNRDNSNSRSGAQQDFDKKNPSLMAEQVDELFLLVFLHEALRISQLDLSQEKANQHLLESLQSKNLKDCGYPSALGVELVACAFRDANGARVSWTSDWKIIRNTETLTVKEEPFPIRLIKKAGKKVEVNQERRWTYRLEDKSWRFHGRWSWQTLPNQADLWETLDVELAYKPRQKFLGSAWYRAYAKQFVVSFADAELEMPAQFGLPPLSAEEEPKIQACTDKAEAASNHWGSFSDVVEVVMSLDYRPPLRFRKATIQWSWQKGFMIPLKDRAGNLITHKRDKNYCRLQPFSWERFFVSPLLSLLGE